MLKIGWVNLFKRAHLAKLTVAYIAAKNYLIFAFKRR